MSFSIQNYAVINFVFSSTSFYQKPFKSFNVNYYFLNEKIFLGTSQAVLNSFFSIINLFFVNFSKK